MTTVKKLLNNALLYDEPLLAHAFYYAVIKGPVSLDDCQTKIPFETLDFKTIQKSAMIMD